MADVWLQGGKDWDSMAEFMSRFGVADMQQSADKVLHVIRNQVRWQRFSSRSAHAPHTYPGCLVCSSFDQ